jgi:hypothetical protein
MSKYTIELRKLINIYNRQEIENWFKDYDLTEYLTQQEIDVIESRGTWTKDILARDIVDHYFMREIGLETPALFKHQVKVKMREIMQEKLPLIYSASIEYDPLVNVNFTETFTRNIDNTSETKDKSTSNNSGLTVNSDTPQGQISKTAILGGSYASSTSAGESESETNGESNGKAKTKEEYTKTTKGNSGVSATAQAMVKQYRQNIIAINKDIIEELSDLFFGLY